MTVKKKEIFNWNHISSKLTEDQIVELKTYYKVYHRKCWAYKKSMKRFKKIKLIGNSLSVIFATGSIASAVATGGISIVAISTISVLIQGFMVYKNLDLNIQNCTYAYQSYQHLLISIKNTLRSGEFDIDSLRQMMSYIDGVVTDLAPDADKLLLSYDSKFVD